MLGHRRLETFALCFSWLSSRALEVWRFRLQYDYATIGGRHVIKCNCYFSKALFSSIQFLFEAAPFSSMTDIFIHSKTCITSFKVTTQKRSQLQCGQKGRFSNDLQMYWCTIYGTGAAPEGDHSTPYDPPQ